MSKTHLDASTGVRRKVLIELSLLAIFALSMLVAFFIPANGKEGNLFQVSSKSLAADEIKIFIKIAGSQKCIIETLPFFRVMHTQFPFSY